MAGTPDGFVEEDGDSPEHPRDCTPPPASAPAPASGRQLPLPASAPAQGRVGVPCYHCPPPHRRGVTGAKRFSSEPNSSLARRSSRSCNSSWSKNAQHLSVSSFAAPTGAPPARTRVRSTAN